MATQITVISAMHIPEDGIMFQLQFKDMDANTTENVPYVFRADDPYSGQIGVFLAAWISDHPNDIGNYVPPEENTGPYQIAKTTPWIRMTPSEAQTMDAVMSETDAQQRQIYMAATYLASNDPLWQTLWQLLADNFGPTRANQLLAPES